MTPSFIIEMIKERGLLWCIKTAISKITRPISWVFPITSFIFMPKTSEDKRILALWDFKTYPYSVGDILQLIVVTMCMRISHKVEKIDYCFICDPQDPSRSDQNYINSENYHIHLAAYIPLVNFNPYTGSIFLFDSRKDAEKFIIDNVDKYYTWPGGTEFLSRDRVYRQVFDDIQKFYLKNNYVPHLTCRLEMKNWADDFIKQNISPLIPVVVQIRNNPDCDPKRNSNIDVWLNFFNYCKDKFPVKFIIICSKEEVDERLRNYSNIIIAKDFNTTLEQDLSLVQNSAIFMGMPSGPSSPAVFSDVPYLIFRFKITYESMKPGSQFIFANDTQKIFWEEETTEKLIEEFTSIFNTLDQSIWHKK